MKIVRLTTAQFSEWRSAPPYLVDDEGHLIAELDRALSNALDTVMRSARSQRKTLTQRVSIGSAGAAREHAITVSVRRTGMNDTDVALSPTIDGHRVMSGKEVFCAKMFQQHGECQLRASNGVILKFVRDPAVHRPTAAESAKIAPSPEHCPCKNWGRPHPGTHYPTCQWNRLAPPEERAPSDAVPDEEVRMLPTEAFTTLGRRSEPRNPATAVVAAQVDPRAVVVEPPPLDAPETCRNKCREWATPKGAPIPDGQHHPTCYFARAWAIKTAREAPRCLVDLRTGEVVRHADNEEVGLAEVQAQKTGSPIIHIDDVPYAVILEKELLEKGARAGGDLGVAPARAPAPGDHGEASA